MAYRLIAKKLISWRVDEQNIQAGETFVIEGPNLNSVALKEAIRNIKGRDDKFQSAISSTPSNNDWII